MIKIKIKELTLVSLLSLMIFLSGAFKIPTFVLGAEFQLSAPIAVAIMACFGFKRYFLAGIIASIIGFMLGTYTFIGVVISMVFRIIVGIIINIFGKGFIPIILSGPIGTLVARLVLWQLFNKGIISMIIASLPGMIYTAITVWPITKLLERAKCHSPWREINYERRNI